ncbi:MAG: hypothetical protein JWM85_1456, partial [Acidimicrobiaceae bacterium]|nr:hypothetical protein [Acidimicrobiaceae bacterium]
MAATATVHEAAVPSRSARATAARRLLGGLGWAFPLLGFLGSTAIAISGPRLVDGGAVTWWYSVSLSGGGGANKVLLYLGLGALVLAWLGVGRRLAAPGTPIRLGGLWILGAVWAAPLLVGPALFSQDMYSYLAQGAILHLGLDPYRQAPGVLANHGYRHLLDAVSPFWRTTTAPYGPAFLGLIGVFVGAAGSNLVAGILLARLAEVLGVVLVALFAPRLARLLGANPLRAVWLAALSPLALVELLAAGHNDALMAGLMLAGVTLALQRHPLWGIGLCSLAATVKLPALAAALFIAVAFARSLGG